jgi:NitT/TauT family transport system ATP-binding protein
VKAQTGQTGRPAPAGAASASRARPTSIEIEGLGKIFRRKDLETRALDAVDLQVGSGEFLAVVGPSGCGKSTLLRLIAGLIPPSAGRVVIDGQSVSGPQTQLGIVFQKPVLLEWRTVLGNVLLQAEMRRLDASAYLERARRLLSAVGLGDFEDRYPHELSGGMQQRAAIVRALIHDPPLLLMDEPFGALDALTREQMRIDLEDLWLSTQKTVVFITHSIDEAVLLADRVMVMSPRPGRIERIIDVDLPRPRGLEARGLEKFDQAVAAITEIFLARGVLHSGARGPKLLHTEEA